MTRTGDVGRGIVLGLVGGLLAAGAMSLAHRIVSELAAKGEPPATPKAEDSTVKVAEAAMGLAGLRLPDDQKPIASNVVHYAFGASVGALYGGVAEVFPRVATAFGLPFGAAVWLGAHVIAVPALGLAASPSRQPVGKEAEEFGLHLLYGLTTELVRRLKGVSV